MTEPEARSLCHEDTTETRRVWVPGTSLRGTEILTLCGVWLPAWEDGPDGPDNARRWTYSDNPFPECPECARIAAEEDEEEEEEEPTEKAAHTGG
jgi:hypothetical protein